MKKTFEEVKQGRDTLDEFRNKVLTAKINGEDFVETTPEIFDYFIKGHKTPYFWYEDVRVYKYGEKEGIETMEAQEFDGVKQA